MLVGQCLRWLCSKCLDSERQGQASFVDSSYSRLASKCVKIARPTLMGYVATREEFEKYAYRLFDLLATGKLKTRIYKAYPLEEVQQAHRVSVPSSTPGLAPSESVTLKSIADTDWDVIGSGRAQKYWEAAFEAADCGVTYLKCSMTAAWSSRLNHDSQN